MISNKNIRIYVTVSRDTHEWLKEAAAKDERNVSNLVNLIIKKHIASEENKDNPPE